MQNIVQHFVILHIEVNNAINLHRVRFIRDFSSLHQFCFKNFNLCPRTVKNFKYICVKHLRCGIYPFVRTVRRISIAQNKNFKLSMKICDKSKYCVNRIKTSHLR